MNSIDVTVITVCLNAGLKLDKTVKSVLSQNISSFEYLIKDGGSTDGSIERIPNDPRIKIIRNPDNGIFDAMNQALYAANGRLINFLNAGDTFYDDHVISLVINQIKKDNSIDFLYGDVYNETSRAKYILYPTKLSKYFLFSNSICHQAWFLSKRIQIDCGGYNTSTKIGGDYLMFLDVLLKKKVKYKKIERIIVDYLGAGISSQKSNMKDSLEIRKMKRKELFSKIEYICFSILQWLLYAIKILFYDRFAYKIVRRTRKLRYST